MASSASACFALFSVVLAAAQQQNLDPRGYVGIDGNDLLVRSPPGGRVLVDGVDVVAELKRAPSAAAHRAALAYTMDVAQHGLFVMNGLKPDGGGDAQRNDLVNFVSGGVTTLSDPPFAVHGARAFASGKRLWIVGGSQGSKAALCDVRSDAWMQWPLPQGFAPHAFAASWGPGRRKWYALGSVSNTQVWSIEADSTTFQKEPFDLPTQRGGACAFSYQDDSVCVLGGYINNAGVVPVPAFECYNFTSTSWATLPPLPGSRYQHGCAVWGNSVLVFGGVADDHQGSVLRYDFETGSWDTRFGTDRAGYFTDVAAVPLAGQPQGRVLTVTVHSGTDVGEVLWYAPDTDTWTLAANTTGYAWQAVALYAPDSLFDALLG